MTVNVGSIDARNRFSIFRTEKQPALDSRIFSRDGEGSDALETEELPADQISKRDDGEGKQGRRQLAESGAPAGSLGMFLTAFPRFLVMIPV